MSWIGRRREIWESSTGRIYVTQYERVINGHTYMFTCSKARTATSVVVSRVDDLHSERVHHVIWERNLNESPQVSHA